ncbi:hypothetical protein SXCC_00589 [Gluconacetobacter sp. SXCC-1]|nr:hypothetical protein SXCC_00589 [Gluconacetobacter sp. SXCC-1]
MTDNLPGPRALAPVLDSLTLEQQRVMMVLVRSALARQKTDSWRSDPTCIQKRG